MDWQILAAVTVPLLGVLTTFLQGDRSPGAYRRLRHSAAALEQVPTNSTARTALDELVAVQATHLKSWEERKLARRLNPTNLILSLLLLVLGGVAAYFLWAWSASTWGTGLGWVAVPVSVVVGVVLILFIGAAFGTIYKPNRTAEAH